MPEAPAPRRSTPGTAAAFPIVGIGASAGGLEALERFLGAVPAGCGMAFVVVQHLDPTQPGMLVELLRRATALPVVQISDRMPVQADQVHVIPPNRDLTLLHGRLHLLEPVAPRGLRLPIDFFFRSLAQDCGDLAIGIILSGMGSDGSLGLRAIREVAGLGFVQTPASAKFDGMPRSAIDAGLADGVAAPEALFARVAASLMAARHPGRQPEWPPRDLGSLEKIVILLRAQTGQDFSLYKKPTLQRRIQRRMALHQLTRIQDYVHFLRENRTEMDLLFQELLIGVTQFFRDPEAWTRLRELALAGLFAAHPQGAAFRAWVPGCSTGEEAYSLAILFREALERLPPGPPFSLLVFATDLDKNAIDRARQGLYPPNVAADVTEARLNRYFEHTERGYQVNKAIRQMVIFAPQNLTMDPPFTNLNLLSCRNLLIYLDPELQKKLLPLFHYSLKPGGILFLGAAETVGAATELFAPLDRVFRIYRRLDQGPKAPGLEFPSRALPRRLEAVLEDPASAERGQDPPNLQALTEQFLLRRYVPCAVLVGPQGDLLFTTGRSGNYLEPPVGKANLNLFAMARQGLDTALNAAFSQALREQKTIRLHHVKVGTQDGSRFVNVAVEPLLEPELLKGKVMILFSESAGPSAAVLEAQAPLPLRGTRRDKALQEALKAAQSDLETTREEMFTSREELQSTNEELQSINEELQSTNEEITTSKEEMQSMNEELQTVNLELQAKLDELSGVHGDLRNLLNCTDIATLFLDQGFRIRRYTTQAAALFHLMPADLGRPITDLTTTLVYAELAADVRGVLDTLLVKERRVPTREAGWYAVRIVPYRTSDNRIDGVVITFTDITALQSLEEALRQAKAEPQGRREQS